MVDTYLSPQLLGKSFPCTCGRTHEIPVRYIYVGRKAKEKFPTIERKFHLGRKTLLVADSTTYKAAGKDLFDFLRERDFPLKSKILCSGSEYPLQPTKQTAQELAKEINHNFDFLISVGSGTITDLVRYAATTCKIPFVSYPTAPSMNGYTSSIAALLDKGFKTTLDCVPPLAVLADTSIIRRAPLEMIKAGLADLLSKTVAGADWKMAQVIWQEYFCSFSLNMVKDVEKGLARHAAGLPTRDEESISYLTKALLVSGLSMTAAGTSAPSSGAEHLISHYWDITQPLARRKLHGLQVGIGTLVSSHLYQRLFNFDPRGLNMEKIRCRYEQEREFQPGFRKRYGKIAPRLIREYSSKMPAWQIKKKELSFLKGNWEYILRETKPFASPPQYIEDILTRAQVPTKAHQLGYSKEELKEAILHAREIRGRYTLLDLAGVLGFLEDFADNFC